MTLVLCPACRTHVRVDRGVCPHCARPIGVAPGSGRPWLAVIAGAGLLVSCDGLMQEMYGLPATDDWKEPSTTTADTGPGGQTTPEDTGTAGDTGQGTDTGDTGGT